MSFLKRKSPFQKEYEKIAKEEAKYIVKRSKSSGSFLNGLLSDKIPQKLQYTLDKAFEKAFTVIFDKGTFIIEKTYSKGKMQDEYILHHAEAKVRKNKKSIKAFNKSIKKRDHFNFVSSGISGAGLGLLGIGLPDIPLFTSMMLRDIYETSTNFGFPYNNERERYFILKIIEGALSPQEKLIQCSNDIDDFIKTGVLPNDYDEKIQIEKTSKALSDALLYMKFLQGIPVVGLIGGIYDAVYMKNIAKYSTLKYRKRYIRNHMEKERKS